MRLLQINEVMDGCVPDLVWSGKAQGSLFDMSLLLKG